MTEFCRNEGHGEPGDRLTIYALASRTGARLFMDRARSLGELTEVTWPAEGGRAWLRLVVPAEARPTLEQLAAEFELTLVEAIPVLHGKDASGHPVRMVAPPGGPDTLYALDTRQKVNVPIQEERDEEITKIEKQRLWEKPTIWWGG